MAWKKSNDQQLNWYENLWSLDRTRQFDDATMIIVLTVSFVAGIVIGIGAFQTLFLDDGPTGEAGTTELARLAVDPLPQTEVAGAVCEDPAELLQADASANDLVALWNSAVVAEGDSCTPAFAETLGASWVMSDPEAAEFGDAGSQYEIEFRDDVGVVGLFISLDERDGSSGEGEVLRDVLENRLGAENIDWQNFCGETERPWAGRLSVGQLALSVTRCDVF